MTKETQSVEYRPYGRYGYIRHGDGDDVTMPLGVRGLLRRYIETSAEAALLLTRSEARLLDSMLSERDAQCLEMDALRRQVQEAEGLADFNREKLVQSREDGVFWAAATFYAVALSVALIAVIVTDQIWGWLP